MPRVIFTYLLLNIIALSCNKKGPHETLLGKYLKKDSWKVAEYTTDAYMTPEDSVFVADAKNYKLVFNESGSLQATNLITNNVLHGSWRTGRDEQGSDSAFSLTFESTRLAISGIWIADTITESRITADYATYYSVRMVLIRFN